MKLIGVEAAKSIQVFVNEEVRSISGGYFPESVRLITERYGFSTSPNVNEAMAGGAKFTNGRLIAGARRINIFELIVYNNAIQVTTQTNTEDADYIVEDMSTWSMSTFGLRAPQTSFPRIYESALVIDFDRDPDGLLRTFQKLVASLGRSLSTLYGIHASVNLAGFGMGVDPMYLVGQLPPPVPAILKNEFSLVRRTNAPYAGNRFFSLAPLPTDAHRDLLEEFERGIPA